MIRGWLAPARVLLREDELLRPPEEGLKNRTDEEMNRRNADKPLAERLKPILEEQKAIAEAAPVGQLETHQLKEIRSHGAER